MVSQLSLGTSSVGCNVSRYFYTILLHNCCTASWSSCSTGRERELSSRIDEKQFKSLLEASSPANKAQLLSASASHAASWLSVVPSMGLGLHMECNELGVGVGGTVCPLCTDVTLDPLGHHAVTCRHGGDVVVRHNHLCDVVVDFCR